MGFLDTLLKASKRGQLPTPRYFLATDFGPIGMLSGEGQKTLLMWKTENDAEESRVGLGLPTDGELYEVRTIERLATLFGIAEDIGYTNICLNPPPTPGRPMFTMTLRDCFEEVRKVVA